VSRCIASVAVDAECVRLKLVSQVSAWSIYKMRVIPDYFANQGVIRGGQPRYTF